MDGEPRWRRYLRLWGEDPKRDADDELEFHFAAHVRDLVRAGRTRADAEAEARSVFGDEAEIRRQLEDLASRRATRLGRAERWRLMLSDLRVALRTLVRRPAYALAASLTLALGVGVAAAVFAVLHGILLRPLPYPGAERVVVLWEHNVPRARERNVVSVPAFELWSQSAASHVALAGLVPHRTTLTTGTPERVYGAEVSPSWFDVVGVPPRIGRGFGAAEAGAQPRPIVLSDALWRERFGGDARIVDRTVEMGGDTYRVTGVMPPDFVAPAFGWLAPGQRYWVPFMPDADNREWGRFLLVLGRLRDGASIAAADAELKAIAAQPAPFDENDEWTADVTGLRTEITGEMRAPGGAVMAAVGLLLLIAIANVAGVVRVRARGRQDELLMRMMLGATRARVARQLLVEGAAIAILSLPGALLLAFAGVRAARRLLPAELPRIADVTLSWPAVGLALGALAFAAVLIGLAPLLRARGGSASALVTHRITPGRDRVFVGLELALAVALTATAVLATRSLLYVRAIDPGFDADGVAAARLSLFEDEASDDARRLAAADLQQRIVREPDVGAAGLISYRPLSGGNPATGVVPHATVDMDPVVADVLVATADYFPTVGIHVIRGSPFTADGPADSPKPVLISESLAREIPGDVIGRRVTVRLSDPFLEGLIVGVVEDVRLAGPLVEPRAAVYFRFTDWPVNTLDIVARAAGPAGTSAAARNAIRRAVRAHDPRAALWDEVDVAAALRSATAREQSLASVLAAFSVLALLLAAAGVYAAAAVRAAERRREFGVRLALGATPTRLGLSVLREMLVLALPGIVIGGAAVAAAAGLIRSLLHGIEPADPLTLVIAALTLLVVSLAASALPAWRAGHVQPTDALRQ